MGSAQKSMMKSIFVLGYDCNKMFRYHFTQRLLMISTIVVLTALHYLSLCSTIAYDKHNGVDYRMGSALLQINDGKHIYT